MNWSGILCMLFLIYSSQMLDRPQKGREMYNSLRRSYSSIDDKIFDFEVVVDFLKGEKIISTYKDFAEVKVKIEDNYKTDVIRFVKDGTMSQSMIDVISKMSKIKMN